MSVLSGRPSTADFVAVIGNPRAGSRTAALAVRTLTAVAELIAGSAGPDPTATAVIDLADLLVTAGPPFGADAPLRYAEPLSQLRSARLLIVATPTYKASYTGLLKSFLDHVPAGALAGVLAVPVTTVGSPAHTLAADLHLRPLLIELGAACPTPALVVGEGRLSDPAAAVDEWLAATAPTLVRWFGVEPEVRRSGGAGSPASEAIQTTGPATLPA